MFRTSGDAFRDWERALRDVADVKDIRKGMVVPIADYKTAEYSEAEKKILSLGLNNVQGNRVGDSNNGKPLYLVQYVWQTIYSPKDLERWGLKILEK